MKLLSRPSLPAPPAASWSLQRRLALGLVLCIGGTFAVLFLALVDLCLLLAAALHQRTPYFVGSTKMVERAEAFMREFSAHEDPANQG